MLASRSRFSSQEASRIVFRTRAHPPCKPHTLLATTAEALLAKGYGMRTQGRPCEHRTRAFTLIRPRQVLDCVIGFVHHTGNSVGEECPRSPTRPCDQNRVFMLSAPRASENLHFGQICLAKKSAARRKALIFLLRGSTYAAEAPESPTTPNIPGELGSLTLFDLTSPAAHTRLRKYRKLFRNLADRLHILYEPSGNAPHENSWGQDLRHGQQL